MWNTLTEPFHFEFLRHALVVCTVAGAHRKASVRGQKVMDVPKEHVNGVACPLLVCTIQK